MTTLVTSIARMSVMPKPRRSPTSYDMKKTPNEVIVSAIGGRMATLR